MNKNKGKYQQKRSKEGADGKHEYDYADDTLRRDFLKTGLTSLSAPGLIMATDRVTAERRGYSLGQKKVVEINLSHNIHNEESLGTACNIRNYSINRNKGIMGFLKPKNLDKFLDSEWIITDGLEFNKMPCAFYGDKNSHLIGQTNYYRTSEKGLYLKNEYRYPEVNIEPEYNNSITGIVYDPNQGDNSNFNETINVEPQEEQIINLPPRKVTVKKNNVYLGQREKPDPEYKTIEVAPSVKIRNNGQIQAFGKEDQYVIPNNPADPFVERFKVAHSELQSSKRVNEKGIELFISKGGNER